MTEDQRRTWLQKLDAAAIMAPRRSNNAQFHRLSASLRNTLSTPKRADPSMQVLEE